MTRVNERGAPDSRPVIVMVHGDFGDAFDAWGACCDEIGPRYRSIAIDRPGLGAALPAEIRFTVAGEAEDLLHVVDTMDLESFHLAGHSYGGLIALTMADQAPERVRSLHLIEPPLLALLPEREDVGEMARRVKEIQGSHGAMGDEAATEAFFAMIGAGHVPERLRGTEEWERLSRHASRFVRSEPAPAVSTAAVDRLDPGMPIGLYTGGRSHPALRAVTQVLAERLPWSRLTDVPRAGHAVQMAGEAFVEPLLALVLEGDEAWPRAAQPPTPLGKSGRCGDGAGSETT